MTLWLAFWQVPSRWGSLISYLCLLEPMFILYLCIHVLCMYHSGCGRDQTMECGYSPDLLWVQGRNSRHDLMRTSNWLKGSEAAVGFAPFPTDGLSALPQLSSIWSRRCWHTDVAPQVDPPYRVTFGDESFVDVDYDPMWLATGLPSARENVVGEWFSSEYFLHLCREVNHRAFLKSSIWGASSIRDCKSREPRIKKQRNKPSSRMNIRWQNRSPTVLIILYLA